jgi:hypothetical protein
VYSFKWNKCGSCSGLTGALRSFLVLLIGLLVVSAVEAQVYNWKPVKIHGGGYVTGILFHPNQPGLMYCRTDVGGSYRWNPANNTWIPLLEFVGYPSNEFRSAATLLPNQTRSRP